MKCPTCNEDMKIQQGVYGEFYFCPNQYTSCTQKTITKLNSKTPSKSSKPIQKYTLAYGNTIQSQSSRNISNGDTSWEQRAKGTPYEGTSCLCGRNDYQMGSDYCRYCGQ